MKKIILTNLSSPYKELIDLIGEDYVFLVGSGISIWEPSGLPSGQNITKYILDEIVHKNSGLNQKQREIIEEWFWDLPFEVVLQRCLEGDKILDWIYSIYSNSKPNSIHKSITNLSNQSKTKFIATTNYDKCLEGAARIQSLESKTIVRRSDTVKENLGDKIIKLFKLHGDASEENRDTIIYKVSQEAKLPSWKRELLKKYVKNKTLLILGYSGLDFELCPELLSLEPKKIIWNFLNEDSLKSSPGFQNYVVKKQSNTEIITLIGDMRLLLQYLGGPRSINNLARSSIDPPAINNMDKELKELWASRILQALGVGGPSIRIFDSIDKRYIENNFNQYQKYEFHKFYGRAHFFKGGESLKKAIEHYQKSIELAPYHRKIDCHIAVTNSFIAKKQFKEANIWMQKTKKYLKYANRNYKAQYLLCRSYLTLKHYKDLDLVYNSCRASKIRKYVEIILTKAAKYFIDTGDYSDFNTCWLMALQMDIKLRLPKSLKFEPSIEGFNHLGYKLPRIILFRVTIEKKETLNENEKALLSKYLRETKILGIGEYEKLKAIKQRI